VTTADRQSEQCERSHVLRTVTETHMQCSDVTEWGKPLQHAVRETPRPGPHEVLLRSSYCA